MLAALIITAFHVASLLTLCSTKFQSVPIVLKTFLGARGNSTLCGWNGVSSFE